MYTKQHFGNHYAFYVTDPKLKQQIRHIIYKSWNLYEDNKEQLPASQPASILKRDLWRISQHPYIITDKADGERFNLILVTLNNTPLCFMVNRKFEAWLVPLTFGSNLYNGTIIDGEFIQCRDKQWIFLCFDLISNCGSIVIHNKFESRLQMLTDMIQNQYSYNNKDAFHVKMKQFFLKKQFSILLQNHLNNLPYNHDGLIFYPLLLPLKRGTMKTLLKWKKSFLNTVDFRVKEISNKIYLYVNDSGIETLYTTQSFQKYWNPFINNKIVECEYVPQSKTWCPKKVRHDKTTPNDIRIVGLTLQNIAENVSLKEIATVITNDIEKT